MDPTFRFATEADADTLLAMMREYYAYDGHEYNEARVRVALLDFLREPSLGAPRSSATRTPPSVTSS